MTSADLPAAPRSADLRNYAIVTGAYWADTLTDGALRVLVLFYFYDLGYTPFQVAMLFLFYEIFGIDGLVGGSRPLRAEVDARRRLAIQICASGCSRSHPTRGWSFVMAPRRSPGIKDLTKMTRRAPSSSLITKDSPRPSPLGGHLTARRTPSRASASSSAASPIVVGFGGAAHPRRSRAGSPSSSSR
jgi:hypothetical protein